MFVNQQPSQIWKQTTAATKDVVTREGEALLAVGEIPEAGEPHADAATPISRAIQTPDQCARSVQNQGTQP